RSPSNPSASCWRGAGPTGLLLGDSNQLDDGSQAQFLKNPGAMVIHRAWADAKMGRDFLAGGFRRAFQNTLDNLKLADGQAVEHRAALRTDDPADRCLAHHFQGGIDPLDQIILPERLF